jgi:predicted kinase
MEIDGDSRMESVIFIGLQASGKSTFYQQRFFNTHVRINLDMLKTRHREKQLMETCLQARQPFVIDNTNPTKEDRQKYIEAAKAAGFRVVGYYFQSQIEECKSRNENRPAGQQVPLVGVLGTYNRLEIPTLDEGFDELHYVRIAEDNSFVVEEWTDEV